MKLYPKRKGKGHKKQATLRQSLVGTKLSAISPTHDILNMSNSSTVASGNKDTIESHSSPELPLKTKELLLWKANQCAANSAISVGGSSQKLKVPRKAGPDFRSPTVKKYEEYMHKLEEQAKMSANKENLDKAQIPIKLTPQSANRLFSKKKLIMSSKVEDLSAVSLIGDMRTESQVDPIIAGPTRWDRSVLFQTPVMEQRMTPHTTNFNLYVNIKSPERSVRQTVINGHEDLEISYDPAREIPLIRTSDNQNTSSLGPINEEDTIYETFTEAEIAANVDPIGLEEVEAKLKNLIQFIESPHCRNYEDDHVNLVENKHVPVSPILEVIDRTANFESESPSFELPNSAIKQFAEKWASHYDCDVITEERNTTEIIPESVAHVESHLLLDDIPEFPTELSKTNITRESLEGSLSAGQVRDAMSIYYLIGSNETEELNDDHQENVNDGVKKVADDTDILQYLSSENIDDISSEQHNNEVSFSEIKSSLISNELPCSVEKITIVSGKMWENATPQEHKAIENSPILVIRPLIFSPDSVGSQSPSSSDKDEDKTKKINSLISCRTVFQLILCIAILISAAVVYYCVIDSSDLGQIENIFENLLQDEKIYLNVHSTAGNAFISGVGIDDPVADILETGGSFETFNPVDFENCEDFFESFETQIDCHAANINVFVDKVARMIEVSTTGLQSDSTSNDIIENIIVQSSSINSNDDIENGLAESSSSITMGSVGSIISQPSDIAYFMDEVQNVNAPFNSEIESLKLVFMDCDGDDDISTKAPSNLIGSNVCTYSGGGKSYQKQLLLTDNNKDDNEDKSIFTHSSLIEIRSIAGTVHQMHQEIAQPNFELSRENNNQDILPENNCNPLEPCALLPNLNSVLQEHESAVTKVKLTLEATNFEVIQSDIGKSVDEIDLIPYSSNTVSISKPTWLPELLAITAIISIGIFAYSFTSLSKNNGASDITDSLSRNHEETKTRYKLSTPTNAMHGISGITLRSAHCNANDTLAVEKPTPRRSTRKRLNA